nr:hypothetical protein [uncultured Flavobacterium sp.]
MQYILTIILSLTFLTPSFGQINFRSNDVYLEVGGAGLFTSLNYERQFSNSPGLGIRAGIGMYSENSFFLSLPVGVNYLFRTKRKDSFIDASLNYTLAREEAVLFNDKNGTLDHFSSFCPAIAYRRHAKNNLMWRISVTTISNNSGLYPWVGFALGKRL